MTGSAVLLRGPGLGIDTAFLNSRLETLMQREHGVLAATQCHPRTPSLCPTQTASSPPSLPPPARPPAY